MINSVIEYLQKPVFNGVGVILSVIFGIMSWVFYQKQKQLKDIWFYVERVGSLDVSVGPEGVGEIVTHALAEQMGQSETRYDVVIWNRGKSTIEGSAISPADPLVLTAGERHDIMSATILNESRKAVSAKVTVDQNKTCAAVDFKFLDWRDGVEITLKVRRKPTAQENDTAEVKKIWSMLKTRRRRAPGIQLSGTVMGVNQMHELRDIPFTVPVTATVIIANLLLALLIGVVFSLSQVLSFSFGILLAGTYAAPALVFLLCSGILWGLIYAWHFRFLPSRGPWFRHEDPDRVRRMQRRAKHSLSEE